MLNFFEESRPLIRELRFPTAGTAQQVFEALLRVLFPRIFECYQVKNLPLLLRLFLPLKDCCELIGAPEPTITDLTEPDPTRFIAQLSAFGRAAKLKRDLIVPVVQDGYARIAEAEAELQSQIAKNHALETELQELQKITDPMRERRLELEKRKDKLLESRRELVAIKEELGALRTQKIELSSQLDEQSRHLAMLENEIELLKRVIGSDEGGDRVAAIHGELSKLNSQLAEEQARAGDFAEFFHNLSITENALQQISSEIQRIGANTRERVSQELLVSRRRERVREQEERLQNARAARERSQKRILQLRDMAESLSAEEAAAKASERKLSEREAEIKQQLDAEESATDAEIKRLESEIAELQAHVELVQKELDAQVQYNETYGDRLRELSEQLEDVLIALSKDMEIALHELTHVD